MNEDRAIREFERMFAEEERVRREIHGEIMRGLVIPIIRGRPS